MIKVHVFKIDKDGFPTTEHVPPKHVFARYQAIAFADYFDAQTDPITGKRSYATYIISPPAK